MPCFISERTFLRRVPAVREHEAGKADVADAGLRVDEARAEHGPLVHVVAHDLDGARIPRLVAELEPHRRALRAAIFSPTGPNSPSGLISSIVLPSTPMMTSPTTTPASAAGPPGLTPMILTPSGPAEGRTPNADVLALGLLARLLDLPWRRDLGVVVEMLHVCVQALEKASHACRSSSTPPTISYARRLRRIRRNCRPRGAIPRRRCSPAG